MPTQLPSGLLIWNATPHPLYLAIRDGVVVAPTDEVINCQPINKTVFDNDIYQLTEVEFRESEDGREVLNGIKRTEPRCLIVGSILAAKAYPGEVVAPIPAQAVNRSQKRSGDKRCIRSDRFTIFNKKGQ